MTGRASLLFVVAVWWTSFAAAQDFTRLSAEARALQQKDPHVASLSKWEEVVRGLENFVERSPGARQESEALLLLARLQETMYRERNNSAALSKAVYFYERLARDHPTGGSADKALLALGDLRRNALGDEVAARAAYYEIIDRYPQSASFAAAKQRVGEQTDTKGKSAPERPPVAAQESPPPRRESRQIYRQENPLKRPLIVIDAGHGGEDKGAAGYDEMLEKDVVLAIARMFEELLRDRLRARTVLTRNSDQFLPLAERTKIANDRGADLFISLHANASEYRTASGIETYYLDNTEEKSSLRLAERENRSLLIGAKEGENFDLNFMLSDFIQSAKLEDSISLAHHLQEKLVETLSRYYQGVNNLGVKKAPFYVLVGAHMPCVLTEISFIDHPLEGKRLVDKRYQRLVALALYQGVREYFARRS